MAPRFRSTMALCALFACAGQPEAESTMNADDIVVCPRGATVQGIDVSDYQGAIDWGAVARSGRAFAWAQVSDGFVRDGTFARNWSGMKAAGMIRGAYQYFETGLDPVAQANLLIDAVGGHLGDGDLPPMLDIESGPGNAAYVLGQMRAWASRIEAALGKKPIIYTGAWWWNPHTGSSGAFGGYPLADSYYSQSCPNIAAGWSSWTVWQYSSSGRVPGISGNVDLDQFNGTLADLRSFAGGGGGAPPPAVRGPCSGKNAGLYCGSDELGLEQATLYRCSGGPDATAIQKCAYGCQTNPAGINDACNPAPGPCTGKESGLWCGASIGLDASELYSCNGGAGAKAVKSCAYGCQQNPPGVNDACKPQPVQHGPCFGKDPGLYCGGGLGLDASTLYNCDGGEDADPAEACGYGCASAGGGDDQCAQPSGPCTGRDPGLYCGTSLSLDASALYSCDGGPDATEWDECAAGCQVNPPGTDDACKLPPGPCAGKQPGLYCGSSLGLAGGSLYECDDGTNDATDVQDCDEGCQVMPPGTDDQCYQADCSVVSQDGAFCGADQIGGNPALLYWCDGGGVASYSKCAGSCAIEPQGTADRCE